MPSWFGNHVMVTGLEDDIKRFMARCFRAPAPDPKEEIEPNVEIEFYVPDHPAADRSTENSPADDCDPVTGGWNNAVETVILSDGDGHVDFEFMTRSDYPRDMYIALGELFPTLQFDIAAIGPQDAIYGEVEGAEFHFDEDADFEEVYERVYKMPFYIDDE